MKTPTLNHTFFKSALLSPLILAQLILSATPEIAFSEDEQNPFTAGTEVLILTDEQKTDLKQYVESTSAKLREALENAKGKGFSEQNSIYLEAIVLVVIESNADNNRSQLLTRFALNQALQLTFGTPLPNGLISKGQGILENMANPELLTVILEGSIQLAINYCPDDLNAIDALKVQDANQLLDLPYDRFAHSRLQLARKWLSSTLDIEASYALSVTAISHWLSSMNRKDQLHLKKYAVEISRANKIVESEMPAKVIQKKIPKDILIGKVRVLRGELRKLDESLYKKVTSNTATPKVLQTKPEQILLEPKPEKTEPQILQKSKEDEETCVGDSNPYKIGSKVYTATGAYGKIAGIFPNGDIAVAFDSGTHKWPVKELGVTSGASSQDARYCVGARVITATGAYGKIAGIFPNGDVAVAFNSGTHKWPVEDLGLQSER